MSEAEIARRETEELRQELAKLRSRLAVLEAGLEQERRLHRRVAELTDLVAQLLLPATRRNEERLTELLDQYSQQL